MIPVNNVYIAEGAQPYGVICTALCGLVGVGCTAALCQIDSLAPIGDIALISVGKAIGKLSSAASTFF